MTDQRTTIHDNLIFFQPTAKIDISVVVVLVLAKNLLHERSKDIPLDTFYRCAFFRILSLIRIKVIGYD